MQGFFSILKKRFFNIILLQPRRADGEVRLRLRKKNLFFLYSIFFYQGSWRSEATQGFVCVCVHTHTHALTHTHTHTHTDSLWAMLDASLSRSPWPKFVGQFAQRRVTILYGLNLDFMPCPIPSSWASSRSDQSSWDSSRGHWVTFSEIREMVLHAGVSRVTGGGRRRI